MYLILKGGIVDEHVKNPSPRPLLCVFSKNFM